jgi:hypothetical protein
MTPSSGYGADRVCVNGVPARAGANVGAREVVVDVVRPSSIASKTAGGAAKRETPVMHWILELR